MLIRIVDIAEVNEVEELNAVSAIKCVPTEEDAGVERRLNPGKGEIERKIVLGDRERGDGREGDNFRSSIGEETKPRPEIK